MTTVDIRIYGSEFKNNENSLTLRRGDIVAANWDKTDIKIFFIETQTF